MSSPTFFFESRKAYFLSIPSTAFAHPVHSRPLVSRHRVSATCNSQHLTKSFFTPTRLHVPISHLAVTMLSDEVKKDTPSKPTFNGCADEAQHNITTNPTASAIAAESEDDDDDGQTSKFGDDLWYSIDTPIAKSDTEAIPLSNSSDNDAVLDLKALEQKGRQVLAKASYESVVDVDVDKGGVLDDDEDNNDLFSGVGFDALIESEILVENLRKDGLETTTHVQLAGIPRVLDGRDLVMQSYTGTGKTLAFLLPILDEIVASEKVTQAMIVAPTRELGMQISRECDRLIVGTDIVNLALIGGANPARQVDKLRRSVPHIVVGTPGRLAELAENGDLRIRAVRTLVVDEVDQCLVGEFGEQVHRLLRVVPKKVQKVLVSATGDVDSVRRFAGSLLDDPVLLRVAGALRVPKNISHWMCVVPGRLKLETVRKILFCNPVAERAIVFVDEPRRVDLVAERLWQMRVAVGALRGNANKMDRKETLEAFRKGRVTVLVSTEVAARGLDVPEMTHVINLDLPTDADHYVHRAGRCGRAGKEGNVVSITTGEHAFVLRRMSKELKLEIRRMEPRGGEYCDPLVREGQNEGGRGRRDMLQRKGRTGGEGGGGGVEQQEVRSENPTNGTKVVVESKSNDTKVEQVEVRKAEVIESKGERVVRKTAARSGRKGGVGTGKKKSSKKRPAVALRKAKGKATKASMS